VGLLDAGRLQILQNHPDEVAVFFLVTGHRAPATVNQLVIGADRQRPVRGDALDRERPGHADRRFVLVRFVVQVLELCLGGDRRVDLLLPGDPCGPPVGEEWLSGRWSGRSRGISHSSSVFF